MTLTITEHGEMFLTELLNEGRSPLTVKAYRYCLNYFDRWLDAWNLTLETLGRIEFDNYLTYLRKKKYDPRTIRGRANVVRYLIGWLNARGHLAKNPLSFVKAPRCPRRIPDFLTMDEVNKLLDAAEMYPRDRAIIELLYSSGCRRAELIGLNVEDVDLKEGLIRIQGKGGRERMQPIGGTVIVAIRRWLIAREEIIRRSKAISKNEPALFTGRKGRLLSTQVGNLVKLVGERARLNRPIHPHMLRHSFCSHLLDGGADIRHVQELAGHANIQSTMIYTHVSRAKLREVYDRAHPRAVAGS